MFRTVICGIGHRIEAEFLVGRRGGTPLVLVIGPDRQILTGYLTIIRS
jgi:hypothetical protein